MPKPDKPHKPPWETPDEEVDRGNCNTKLIKALYRQLHTLLNIEEQLTLGETDMDQATTALIARIDAATNAIAAKIQALIDKAAAAGSVTSAEVNAALEPVVTNLEALGHDPNNPVPTPV